jgi:hypothetical protein
MNTLFKVTVLGLIAVILIVGLTAAGENVSNPSKRVSKPVLSKARSGETIGWQVIASGGTESASENFSLGGTVGQTEVGESFSESFGATHGFWQAFYSEPEYICGDADGSGGDPAVDIDDVVFLINYIFASGPQPEPIEAGDADCSGGDPAVDIDDVVYLINYIFGGGYAPCDTDGNGVPDC